MLNLKNMIVKTEMSGITDRRHKATVTSRPV